MVFNPCPDGWRLVGGVCVPTSNDALMKWKSRQGKSKRPSTPDDTPDTDPDNIDPVDPGFWDNLNDAIAKDKQEENVEEDVGAGAVTAGGLSVAYATTKKAQRAMRQGNKQKIDEVTEDDIAEDIEMTERESMNLFEDVVEEEELGEEDAFLGGQTGTEMTGLRQRNAGAGATEESTLLEGETDEMILGEELAEEEVFLTTEELVTLGGGVGLIVGGLYLGADAVDSDFGKVKPLQTKEEAEMSGRDNVEVAQDSLNAIGNIFD